MHEQYQKVVNAKDRELEDNAYRIKALASVKQNELSFMRKSTNEKIERLEQEIEGYEVRRQYNLFLFIIFSTLHCVLWCIYAVSFLFLPSLHFASFFFLGLGRKSIIL